MYIPAHSLDCAILAIYAPMIYTAPCVLLLSRQHPLRGQVGGGWALEIETFLGPVKWRRADRRVPFGSKKVKVNTLVASPPLMRENSLKGQYCSVRWFFGLFIPFLFG
jgi:hypothetical protein